ncbi:hypothetical protein CLU86_3276 [Acidovorax sp. 62]|nr:hypothetical protein CLU86_3276 [Acidovorax sp. 62]
MKSWCEKPTSNPIDQGPCHLNLNGMAEPRGSTSARCAAVVPGPIFNKPSK